MTTDSRRLLGAVRTTVLLALALSLATAAHGQVPAATNGAALYGAACAACHGRDGRGSPGALPGLSLDLPDLTDCRFSSREPDADWHAIVRDGGPARAFDAMMPAFGDALAPEQIAAILRHVRGFCLDTRWPRGELNLPRPLFTEKAYPEDEAVVTSDVALEGHGAVLTKLVYERRIGARAQWEVVVPLASHAATGGRTMGVGDVALGAKRVLAHSLPRGTVVSVTGEIVLPTGSRDAGRGRGVTVLEPFLTVGQLLPGDAFVQFQGGIEVPLARREHHDEVFWRTALGRSFDTRMGTGRTWSPMVEVLGARELADGARVAWDVVPQVQVTLSTRQHIMLNVGLRVPMTDGRTRPTRLAVYLLWDWFDGGFFEGW
jgi:mono/diheme cytochrome c family protein